MLLVRICSGGHVIIGLKGVVSIGFALMDVIICLAGIVSICFALVHVIIGLWVLLVSARLHDVCGSHHGPTVL